MEFTIFPYLTSYKALQEQKKLKMLGWVSKARNSFIPELASFGESKVLPNFAHSIWAGMFVRKENAGSHRAVNQRRHCRGDEGAGSADSVDQHGVSCRGHDAS